jgi:hypothetical protein
MEHRPAGRASPSGRPAPASEVAEVSMDDRRFTISEIVNS